jgi:hypothetical protein
MRELLENHANGERGLTIERFVPDRRKTQHDELIEDEFVLIKGSPGSLRFLGELLLRFADSDLESTFGLHPNGAGSAHFSKGTRLGIYFAKEPLR